MAKQDIQTVESEAYKLLIDQHLPIAKASRQLALKGINLSPGKLLRMKENMFEVMQRDERAEHMCEMMFDSVDRVRFEFDDLVNKTKKLIDKFEEEGKSFQQMTAMRDLHALIVTALKKLGEFKDGMVNVQAKNVNILNAGDFNTAFRRMQELWFDEMQATVKDGKLIFENPKPEFLDDFYKWKAKKMRTEARQIGETGQFAES